MILSIIIWRELSTWSALPGGLIRTLHAGKAMSSLQTPPEYSGFYLPSLKKNQSAADNKFKSELNKWIIIMVILIILIIQFYQNFNYFKSNRLTYLVSILLIQLQNQNFKSDLWLNFDSAISIGIWIMCCIKKLLFNAI